MISVNLFAQVHPLWVFLIILHGHYYWPQMPGDFFFQILPPSDTFTKSITSVVSPCCLLASLARFKWVKFKKSLIVYCLNLNKIFFLSNLTSSVGM